MKMQELRELNSEQLRGRMAELAGELATLREAVHFGKEKNHAKIAVLKKDIARTQTALRLQS